MAKEIKLNHGQVAIVDDADYEMLMVRGWWARKSRKTFYAEGAHCIGNQKSIALHMHREIMGLRKGDRLQVDHINGNGLDNRRCNLRVCTQTQNIRAQKIRTTPGKTSRFRGVIRDLSNGGRKQWRAMIFHDKKLHHLGRYLNEEDAARAYNAAAQEHFKEFAVLNPVSA